VVSLNLAHAVCFKSGCLSNLLTLRHCTVNLCIRGLAASAGVWPSVTGNDQRRSMESTLHPLLCYLFKCGLSNTTSQNSHSVLHIQFLPVWCSTWSMQSRQLARYL